MNDARHAAERLRKLLRAAQFPQLQALRLEGGDVADLLRILHFVLLDSSRAVAQFLVGKGYDLCGKTDARFVESAFRLLRDEFRCFPTLSPSQFLSSQFVARRLNLVADAAAAVAKKHQELQSQKRRQEAVWSQPQSRLRRASVENHLLPTAMANHAASILQQLNVQGEERRRPSPGRGGSQERLELGVTPPPAPAIKESSTAYTVEKEWGVEAEAKRSASPDRRPPEERPKTTVMPLAAPVFSDTMTSAHGVDSRQNGMVDDSVKTTIHSPQRTCRHAQEAQALKQAIGDLSNQLSEVSRALMGKMSSVESRLDRLETNVRGVQVAIDEERVLARQSSVFTSRTADSRKSGGGDKNSEPQRTFDTELPCAWPPHPSVFERH